MLTYMLYMFTGDGHKKEKQNTCKYRKKVYNKKTVYDFVIDLDRDFRVNQYYLHLLVQ